MPNANKDKLRAHKRAYYEANKEKIRARRLAYYGGNKEMFALHQRKSALKLKYNMTLADFDELAAKQSWLCLICNKGSEKLVVDHDHVTGHIRGLLCNTCNMAIGMLGDSPDRLRQAAMYIESTTRRG